MSAYKAKPPDQFQVGGDYDPSSLSKVQSFGDIPAAIRADTARFGSLGDFTLALMTTTPVVTSQGVIIARPGATNGWLNLLDYFVSNQNSIQSIDKLLAGTQSSITPIRFVLRHKTRMDSFVEFELASLPRFFEAVNTPAREISYQDALASERRQPQNAYIRPRMTLYPQTVAVSGGSVWKTGSFSILSSIYGLNNYFYAWYNGIFMRFQFRTTSATSLTQNMEYQYQSGGVYVDARTAPFFIPSSLTSSSASPMIIDVKRNITLTQLTPIVRRQSGTPRFGELYELYWVFAGNNSYLNDILISSGVITKSVTDIQTNIGIINNYNATINTLSIEINTSSLLSAAAIITKDNAYSNRNVSCSLYSTNLEAYQALSTAYVSTLSSYQTSLDDYIRVSTQAFLSTQASLSTIRALANSFSSIQDEYDTRVRNYNLQTIIKPGLEASLPILYRISTLYALNDTTALGQLYAEYPNLSTIIQNYESTIRGPNPTAATTSYSGVVSTLSAGRWIQRAVSAMSLEEYIRAYMGVGGSVDEELAVQSGGATMINASLMPNPYFRIGRISEMIKTSENAREKRATLRIKESAYLNARQTRDGLFSTFYLLDQSSIRFYTTWQNNLSSKALFDELYISSLTEYNVAYVGYTTIYNQVAYLSSYRDEILAFSTMERAKQRKRLLQESLDQFNAGYDGTPLYTAAIQSGGATATDVNLALQTQDVLINTAETEYYAKQGLRVQAEANISQNRDGPLESTISGYNILISNYLDEMTLYTDKVSTTQLTLKGLSTQWLALQARNIQSTFIIDRYASTSTFYGNQLANLRSNLETASRDQLSLEMQYMLKQVDYTDAIANIATNAKDRAERVDEIAAFCKGYEEAQRTFSTIIESMKSYATLFEQQYVAPQPLPVVNVRELRTFYGIPEPDPATSMVGGAAPPTYVTSSDIANLNRDRVTQLEQYLVKTGIRNSTFRSLAQKEISTYSLLLSELSTTIETDLSLKRYKFALNRVFEGSADPASTFGYRAYPAYGQVLSLRETTRALLMQLENERNQKEDYIYKKALYDLQLYYSKTPAIESNTMSRTDFRILRTQYDYSIQLVNNNISLRRNYFDVIKRQVIEFSTTGIIDRQLALNYANSTITTDKKIIPSRQKALFDMSFNFVPLRANYFTDPVIIQEAKEPVCPAPPGAPVVQNRATPVAPTTTAPTTTCGYTIRYIDISHSSDTFSITQIIAVDRTGKNVAFRAGVSLTPAGFQAAKGGAAAVLTNGLTYSTELVAVTAAVSQNFISLQGQDGGTGAPYGKTIRVDLGRNYEITLVGVHIAPNSGYNTTGLRITTYAENGSLSPPQRENVNPYTLNGNVSPVLIDRRAPTASPTCPIAIMPQRRGICGLLAQHIRIYPPADAPVDYAFTFSQIAVVDSNGRNVALNKPANFKGFIWADSNGRSIRDILTSGVYMARQASSCIRCNALANGYDYLYINLESEMDVAAVHIYNQIGGTSLLGCSVRLYTADFLLAEQRTTISNDRREIVDFRYNGADANCSKLIRWPSMYGEAGIKARYVHVFRPRQPRTGSLLNIRIIDRNGRNIGLGKPIRMINATAPLKSMLTNSIYPSVRTPITITNTDRENQIIVDLGANTEVCAVEVAGLSLADTTGINVGFSVPIASDSVAQSGMPRVFQIVTPAMPTPTTTIPGFEEYGVTFKNPNGDIAMRCSVRFSIGGSALTTIVMQSQYAATGTWTSERTQTHSTFGITRQGGQVLTITLEEGGTGFTIHSPTNGAMYTYSIPSDVFRYDINAIQIGTYNLPDFTEILRLTQSNTILTNPYQQITLYIQSIGSNGALWRTGDCDTLYALFGLNNSFFAFFKTSANTLLRIRMTFVAAPTTTTNPIQIEREAIPGSDIWSLVTTTDGLPVNASSSTTSPMTMTLLTRSLVFDTRFDPEGSAFSTTETKPIAQFGTTGLFAQHVLLPISSNALLPESAYVLTDATGKNITQIDTGLQRSIVTYDDNLYMRISLTRIWELTGVGLVDSPSATIVVLDCNSNVAWIDVTGAAPFPVGVAAGTTGTIYIADFRKQNAQDRTRVSAPVYPYPARYGPLNKGVLTRYIQVEPASPTKGLYISQIIAVNACGRNSAFERDTYASGGSATASLAVDGRYEDQLSLNSSPLLLYDNYLKKPLANSYQSEPTTDLRWVVDLGRMFSMTQTSGTTTTTLTGISNVETFCSQAISNTACGGVYQFDSTYEHEINCVIFVAPEGKKADCVGVIVKLLDGNGVVVGIRRTTTLVNIYGVDFLDFRRNTSENLGNTSENLATSIVEPPQRPITYGPNNCGVMAMYIRIEQAASSNPTATLTTANPIRLSQIYVLDDQGRNIALYKPTKSNRIDQDTSYLAVDGRYYEKDAEGSFISDATIGQYIEVNLGCEMPVTKIMAVSARVDENDTRYFDGLIVKVYNQNRDVILTQNLSAATYNAWTLANTAYTKAIRRAGVNIQEAFFRRAYDEGVIPTLPGYTLPLQRDPGELASCDPGFDLNSMLTRGTSSYKGVLTSYIRIYNPNSYIQISQLMIFDDNLTNIARTLPQSRVFATHALPGRQPERAIDGVGGYFHVGRPENQCYISEKKSYEFWQIDVRTETGQPREIVALRYIPPTSNRSRNKGTRFQLIQANAPPIAIGGTQTKYYEVRWPNTPSSVAADEFRVLRFGDTKNPNITYLEFRATFKKENAIVPDNNIIEITGQGFAKQTASASAFGITRNGGAIFYFSVSPTNIKIKNSLTGYEYPVAITPTILISTDTIIYEFTPYNYVRQVDAGAVSQYVVAEYVLRTDTIDQTIDFRQPTLASRPITEVLSPKIIAPTSASLYQALATTLTSFTPTALVEDSGGNLYVASGQYIYKYPFSTNFSQPFIIVNRGNNTIRINALTIDSTDRLWFTTSESTGSLYSTPSVLSATALITATAFTPTTYIGAINSTNLVGLLVTDTTIYVTKDEINGALYSINRTNGAITRVIAADLGNPREIVIRSEGGKNIMYVCCSTDFKVRRFDMTANFNELSSVGMGIADTNTLVISEKIYTYFQSPHGIFNDTTTNTLYISDSIGNKIFYIPPDPSPGVDAKVYTLAGTGEPGNVNPPDKPALDALLNGPTDGIVHRRSGNYIFIDSITNTLRIILLNQTANITTFTDKILPQTLWATTTLPGEDIAPLPSMPVLPQALNRTRDTYRELANTGRLQTKS